MTKVDKADAQKIFSKTKTVSTFVKEVTSKYKVSKNYATTMFYNLKKENRQPVRQLHNATVRDNDIDSKQEPTSKPESSGLKVESNIDVTSASQMPADAKHIQKGFSQMLESGEFQDYPDENEEEEEEADEDSEDVAGNAGSKRGEQGEQPNFGPNKMDEENSGPVQPYLIFRSLALEYGNMMFKERPESSEEVQSIEYTSAQLQSRRLPFLENDPNADVYNYILAGYVFPTLGRLDLVAKRVTEFVSWINNIKTPEMRKSYSQQQTKAEEQPQQQKQQEQPKEKVPLTEDNFDSDYPVDFQYYQQTGKLRNNWRPDM